MVDTGTSDLLAMLRLYVVQLSLCLLQNVMVLFCYVYVHLCLCMVTSILARLSISGDCKHINDITVHRASFHAGACMAGMHAPSTYTDI